MGKTGMGETMSETQETINGRGPMSKTAMGETMSETQETINGWGPMSKTAMAETQETMGETQDRPPPDEAVGRTAERLGEHDQPRRGWQGTMQKKVQDTHCDKVKTDERALAENGKGQHPENRWTAAMNP
jgi:hypothetical protein